MGKIFENIRTETDFKGKFATIHKIMIDYFRFTRRGETVKPDSIEAQSMRRGHYGPDRQLPTGASICIFIVGEGDVFLAIQGRVLAIDCQDFGYNQL